MPCCVAPNCSSRTEKNFRVFRFPSSTVRRAVWIQNMRRDKWEPTNSSRLCEKHFEESQFEACRQDGWKKLKPNAVPTLFNVPNPPPMKNPPPRKSLYKNRNVIIDTSNSQGIEFTEVDEKKFCSPTQPLLNIPTEVRILREISNVYTAEDEVVDELTKLKHTVRNLQNQLQSAHIANKVLKTENQKLRSELDQKKDRVESFLNKDQIKILESGRMSQWPAESIIKGLKFRFALSVHGYKFLRNTGYPLPSYSTLMRKIQDFKLTFGVFTDVLDLLRVKVETMDETDKYCILSYDEMVISEQVDFDKSIGQFSGRVTLGYNTDAVGQKIFTVVVRGIKNRWKQIIACHVTRKERIEPEVLKKFMLECISCVESCGLYVVALSSDLDGRNRSLWNALGINITKFR